MLTWQPKTQNITKRVSLSQEHHTTQQLIFPTIISPPRYEADIFVTSMKWFISRHRHTLRVWWRGKIAHVELITYPSVGLCYPGQRQHKDTTLTLNLVNNLVTHRAKEAHRRWFYIFYCFNLSFFKKNPTCINAAFDTLFLMIAMLKAFGLTPRLSICRATHFNINLNLTSIQQQHHDN